MIKINENFLRLKDNYLFSNINQRVNQYLKQNPLADIIRLGIGDVTRPIPKAITSAIKKAAEELEDKETFKGYGPEQGYDFLKEKIIKNEYRGLNIKSDEVFISDGAKCDTGNIIEIFDKDIKVGITDPVYPVYLDSNIMCGRKDTDIIYINATEKNDFTPIPEELEEVPDLIYICSPNNPTGVAMKKEILEKWVKFAREQGSIILFDDAYEAFIEEEDIPHSIYEIEGAKEVAIEFKSYSKTAGFTGLRCAYTIVPKELVVKRQIQEITDSFSNNLGNNSISINKLWNRRSTTKFNGVSYVIQRAAEAVYTEEGKKGINENIKYYKENTKIILEGLKKAGITCYGGINSPYIWMKIPKGISSWEYFDILLKQYNIVGTPGVGFGTNGEGYFRLTAFGDRDKTKEAMERISKG